MQGKTKKTTTDPAWTRTGYEYEMADRIVANAATIRHANQECARIENRMISMAAARREPDWRFWDGRRGFCANEIILLVRGMQGYGYDTDAKTLGDFLAEKYRAMLRGGEAAKYGPIVYVPDGWLKDLKIPETLALAPRIWKDYLGQFKAA